MGMVNCVLGRSPGYEDNVFIGDRPDSGAWYQEGETLGSQ